MRHEENRAQHIAQRKARYEQEDINGKLLMNLRDTGHIMRGLSEGRGSQKRILTILAETGTITQRELTERLGIQPGSASEVIAKLENAGLLTRAESGTDRRTVDVSLTEAGMRQAEEAKNQQAQRRREMFSALTEGERAQLLGLLEKLNADWENRYGERREHHHGPHDRHGHHGPHGDWEGRGKAHPHCDHDCANCAHPCGKRKIGLEEC